MMTKAMPTATLASLLLLAACDLQVLPQSAHYHGTASPRIAVVIQADAMPGDGVVAVDLELVDVLVHRESDDAWVWVAGDASRVELSLGAAGAQASVPLLADHYDRMLVVVDAPRVAQAGTWQTATLGADEFELPIDLELDSDAELALRFDVGASLSGAHGSWHFEPRASAEITQP